MKRIIIHYDRDYTANDSLLLTVGVYNGDSWTTSSSTVERIMEYRPQILARSYKDTFEEEYQDRDLYYVTEVVRDTNYNVDLKWTLRQPCVLKSLLPIIECSAAPWTDHSTINQSALHACYGLKSRPSGRPNVLYFKYNDYVFGPFKAGSCSGRLEFIPLEGNQVTYWHTRGDHQEIAIHDQLYVEGSSLDAYQRNYLYCFSSERLLAWYRQYFHIDANHTSNLQQLIVSTIEDGEAAAMAKELKSYLHRIQLPETTLTAAVVEGIITADEVRAVIDAYSRYFDQGVLDLEQTRDRLTSELARANQSLNQCKENIIVYEEKYSRLQQEVLELENRLTEQANEVRSLSEVAQELNTIQFDKCYGSIIDVVHESFHPHHRSLLGGENQFGAYLKKYARQVGIYLPYKADSEVERALHNARCIVTKHPFLTRSIAAVTSNAEFYHCNAAHDWTTFHEFNRSIFLTVVSHAISEPTRFVFLQISNFNASAPIAYLHSIVQCLNGQVTTLPGGLSWPANLWLILVPTAVRGDQAIGLPIDPLLFDGVATYVEFTAENKDIVGSYSTDTYFLPPKIIRNSYTADLANNLQSILSEYC